MQTKNAKQGFVIDETQPMVIITKSVAEAKTIARKAPQRFSVITRAEAKIWGVGKTTSGVVMEIR